MRVTCFGVRGSTPVGGPNFVRYGGHTSCVLVECENANPIVIDLGTGLRTLGSTVPAHATLNANVLLSHLHWDHVQGLGFCAPIVAGGGQVNIYGPAQADGYPLKDALDAFMRPPYFPLRSEEFGAAVHVHDVTAETFDLDEVKVTTRWLNHPGPTLGFRIEADGVSMAFCSDHGPGPDEVEGDAHIPLGVLELCDGVDFLIHDAQHTWEEYQTRKSWGHSPIEYAVEVAATAGVQRLGFFHYDPNHTDSMIDAHIAHGSALAEAAGLPETIATYEGLRVELSKELSWQ